MTGETGSYRYMAPEVFSHQKHYSFPCDVYSFAVVLYYLFSGLRPYFEFQDGVAAVKFALTKQRPNLRMVKTPKMRALMTRAWAHKPTERPSMTQLLEDLEELDFEVCNEVNRPSVAVAMFKKFFSSAEVGKLRRNPTHVLTETTKSPVPSLYRVAEGPHPLPPRAS
jgi:serine/threonine protein kinase